MLAWLFQGEYLLVKRNERHFAKWEITSVLKEHFWKAVSDSKLLIELLIHELVKLGVP